MSNTRQSRWNSSDEDQLRKLFYEGKSDREIAKELKRSEDAILGKRQRLGVFRATRRGPYV